MGASFCHVNRIVKFSQDIFLATEINHWNNGAEALFRISDATITNLMKVNFLWVLLVIREDRINITEATDWTIKYFIKDSFSLLAFLAKIFEVIEQNARVLISKRIHSINHEFEKKHRIEDLSSEMKIERFVLICLNTVSSCKLELGWKDNVGLDRL